ncbi:MAG: hypothetical protein WBD99_02410 [Thermodesulfobacteriota bacterium]
MNSYKITAIVDISLRIDDASKAPVRYFLQVLSFTEAMHYLQLAGELSTRLENEIFQQMIDLLRQGGQNLPEVERADYLAQVESISRGIYDLCSLALERDGEEYLNLILGKIFSYEKDDLTLYSGAVGVANNVYKDLMREYDNKFRVCLKKSPFKNVAEEFPDKLEFPDMKCIDVFALAGELNQKHKPICVFFSGADNANTSALTKLIVFINLYILRFQSITMAIAKKLLDGYSVIEGLEYKQIGELLLIWLRGHDIGHFCGEDKLGKVMTQHQKEYLILHELKSDLISLSIMRYLADSILEGESLSKAYLVSIAEMLRYIRRGRFYNYPDSASAFLTYSYLKEHGSIVFNAESNKFEIDTKKLETNIEEMTFTLLELFAAGDASRAGQFINRWGDLSALGQRKLPDELAYLEADDIPYYIDINFTAKGEILDN